MTNDNLTWTRIVYVFLEPQAVGDSFCPNPDQYHQLYHLLRMLSRPLSVVLVTRTSSCVLQFSRAYITFDRVISAYSSRSYQFTKLDATRLVQLYEFCRHLDRFTHSNISTLFASIALIYRSCVSSERSIQAQCLPRMFLAFNGCT